MKQKKKVKHNSGAAMLLAILFFLFASMTIILGITNPILKQARIVSDLLRSKESYYYAEGGLEDALYRIKNNKTINSGDTIVNNGYITTITVTPTSDGKIIEALSNRNEIIRKMQSKVITGVGANFHYGIQSGAGGFLLQNSSTVTGNIFSSGSVRGSGNTIYGDIISAGSNGLIDTLHATGTAYAHTIEDSTIDKDAYYTIKTNTAVGGTSYPNSPDQGTITLPISDAQISAWESDATSGGSVTCSGDSYTINSDVTIGPKEVPCNLNINGTGSGITVTIAGPIWVKGNINITNKATIRMAESLGSQNAAIIADNPLNTVGSGMISVGQNVVFQGSGFSGSYVFIISQNNDAETDDNPTDAISIGNGASALVAYASHGQVTLSQSVSLKAVTAYKVVLKNSANVTYDTGLANANFVSGPSGGWTISSWAEVP
ncbi:MAG: hypothetical protein HY507_01985 [Candidatus Zambryskibacteria bacterium]|nr:hypothetical protein [Candidatus Zambryskibacteria bacterium]